MPRRALARSFVASLVVFLAGAFGLSIVCLGTSAAEAQEIFSDTFE